MEDAKDHMEHIAALLIGNKSGYISVSIAKRFQGPTNSQNHPMYQHEQDSLRGGHGPHPHGQGLGNQSWIDEEQDGSARECEEDDSSFPVDPHSTVIIAPIQDFLVEGSALHRLQKDLENFVLPYLKVEDRDGQPLKEPGNPVPEDTKDTMTEETDGTTLVATDDADPVDNPTSLSIHAPERSRDVATNIWSSLLVGIGIAEPPTLPGYTRLHWRCVSINREHQPNLTLMREQACGAQFFEDFLELEPGGISEMVEHMERHTKSKLLLDDNAQATTAKSNFIQLGKAWFTEAKDSIRRGLKQSKQLLPLFNSRPATAPSTEEPDEPMTEDSLYLMSCVRQGKYGKILHQPRLPEMGCDRDLFRFLRRNLSQCKRGFGSFFSLRRVRGILLIRVSVVPRRRVTVANELVFPCSWGNCRHQIP